MAGPFPSWPAPSRHVRPLSVMAGPFPSRPAPSRHGRPLSVMAGPFPSWPAPFRHGRPLSVMAGPFPSWPAPFRHGRPLSVIAAPPSPAPFRHVRPLSVMAGPFPSWPAPFRHGRPLRHGRACPGHPRLCRPPRRSFASRYCGQHRQDGSSSMRVGINPRSQRSTKSRAADLATTIRSSSPCPLFTMALQSPAVSPPRDPVRGTRAVSFAGRIWFRLVRMPALRPGAIDCCRSRTGPAHRCASVRVRPGWRIATRTGSPSRRHPDGRRRPPPGR